MNYAANDSSDVLFYIEHRKETNYT